MTHEVFNFMLFVFSGIQIIVDFAVITCIMMQD